MAEPTAEDIAQQAEQATAFENESFPFRFRIGTTPPPVILQGRVVTVTPRRGDHVLLELNTLSLLVGNPDTLVSIPFPEVPIEPGDTVLFWGSLRPHFWGSLHPDLWQAIRPQDFPSDVEDFLAGPLVVADGYEVLGTLPVPPPSVLELLPLIPDAPPQPPRAGAGDQAVQSATG